MMGSSIAALGALFVACAVVIALVLAVRRSAIAKAEADRLAKAQKAKEKANEVLAKPVTRKRTSGKLRDGTF